MTSIIPVKHSPEFSTESLLEKIHYIQGQVDSEFRMILNKNWNSEQPEHRIQIRSAMETHFTSYFSREQLALLYDLNWRPRSEKGRFSISHCKSMGGFTFSRLDHGFDVEQLKRISVDILKRTCTEKELNGCPRAEFLWVAKEAGLKAHSFFRDNIRTLPVMPERHGVLGSEMPELVVTDFTAVEWNSHFENKIFSFRLNCKKTLDYHTNKGFIFTEGNELFCCYFR